MIFTPKIKNIAIEIICLLYVFLFIYAATSKLMDFEHFKIQLGQSPLLSSFAQWLSVLVPAAEFMICIMLIFPRYRMEGLFSAYGLMIMFTAYIFIILNYTSFIPCSCGGVLEKLDWRSHMIFNLVFVLLAIVAILLYNQRNSIRKGQLKLSKLLGVLSIVSLLGISIVITLFMLSENIVHYHNKLTRRFPHSPLRQYAISDLKVNSYYIAGADSSQIFLGNVTTPLQVTTLNKQLIKTQNNMINLDRRDLPFRGVRVSVQAPFFFVTDGIVPCVYRGKINDWKADLSYEGGEYFTIAQTLDSSRIAVLTSSKKTGDNIIGIINIGKEKNTILNPSLLQKQLDGVFDTDGQLLYSKDMQAIIYVYAYRNQFTITDKKLKLIRRGNTIDTITKAKLDIAKDKKYKQRKFSKPPLFVNKRSAIYKNLLFVNSGIPGLYEDDKMWERTSIIDVYDLTKESYILSFTINDIDNKKLKQFVVQNDLLYALIGNNIISYKMDEQITSRYIKTNSDNLLAK